MKAYTFFTLLLLLNSQQLTAQLELIESGKVNLYLRVYRTETEESLAGIMLDSEKSGADRVESTLDNLTSGRREEYYIDRGYGPELVTSSFGFKKQLKELFEDDQALIDYMYSQNLGYDRLALLVKMYNGHAPRPFENETAGVSITYTSNGLKDMRDSIEYDIVKIGSQQWMAENLNYDWKCPDCKDNRLRSYCFNCEENGRLYTWEVAKEVCPAGWRLPTTSDFQALFISLGMPVKKSDNVFGMDKDAKVGSRLLKGTGDAQFHIIKPGFAKKGKLKESGESAYFWTATEVENLFDKNEDSADAIMISDMYKNRIKVFDFRKWKGFSVRCVRSGYKF